MTELLPRPSDSESRANTRSLDLARRKSVGEAAWKSGGCTEVKLEGSQEPTERTGMWYLTGWIKEEKLKTKVAGRGREQSRGVSFKVRGSCPRGGMVLEGETCKLRGKEDEPGASSFGIRLSTGR